MAYESVKQRLGRFLLLFMSVLWIGGVVYAYQISPMSPRANDVAEEETPQSVLQKYQTELSDVHQSYKGTIESFYEVVQNEYLSLLDSTYTAYYRSMQSKYDNYDGVTQTFSAYSSEMYNECVMGKNEMASIFNSAQSRQEVVNVNETALRDVQRYQTELSDVYTTYKQEIEQSDASERDSYLSQLLDAFNSSNSQIQELIDNYYGTYTLSEHVNEAAEYSSRGKTVLKGIRDSAIGGTTPDSSGGLEIYYIEEGTVITPNQPITATQSVIMTPGDDSEWPTTMSMGSAWVNPLEFTASIYYPNSTTTFTFERSLRGTNNPKDSILVDGVSTGSGYKPGNKNVPKSGGFLTFEVLKEGSLIVPVRVFTSKQLFVTDKEGNMKTDIQFKDASGQTIKLLSDPLCAVSATEDVTGFVSFNVKPGEKYYVFCVGSKARFGGYVFSTDTIAIDPASMSDVIEALEPSNREPYAVLSEDNTVLTFYYDNQKEARGGMDVGPFNDSSYQSWYSKCGNITAVVFDDSFANCTTLTSTAYWFLSCRKLTTIAGISNLRTDNVTDMNSMFKGCSGLTSLDVSGFNTGNVTNMSGMFYGCSSLTSLDVSNFNTANVRDMREMFMTCFSLKSLDLSNFNTANVTRMLHMFYECSGLTSLDLSSFNVENVASIEYMFYNCSGLTTIYAGSGWDKLEVNTGGYMFEGCTKLVGGAGTEFDASHTDHTYAHIDGGPDNPGYFTDIADTAKVVWSVIGTINGAWDTDTEMTSTDGVNYTTTIPYLAAGSYEYKIRANGSWDENYGLNGEPGGQNISVTVDEDNTGVVITFNAQTKEITDSLILPVYTVAGDFTGWEDSQPMTKDDKGIYSITFDNMAAGNYEYKIRTNGSWDVNYGVDGVFGGVNIPLTVSEAGPVTIYFNPVTKISGTDYPQATERVATPTFSWNEDMLTISSETEGATINYTLADGYYLVGGNGEWNSKMIQKFSHSDLPVSEDPIYSYILTGGQELWFAFGDAKALYAINDHEWTYLYGTTGQSEDMSGSFERRYMLAGDHSFHVDGSAPYYRFTINVQNNTYEITPLDTNPGANLSADSTYAYNGPVEIQRDVFIIANASKPGMIDSKEAVLDYPYTAWQYLLMAADTARTVIRQYEGNSNVNQQELSELAARDSLARNMYYERVAERNEIVMVADSLLSLAERIKRAAVDETIQFADANVKAICVSNWDTNGDGELSKTEAAAVTSLNQVFYRNKDITSFDEFQYFTGVKEIGEREFMDCSKLSSIILPSTLESINREAFYYCGLSEITIPASVISIHYAGLYQCFGDIYVDSDNPNYCSVDGVLYSKDLTKILCYPVRRNEESYTILSSVTVIGGCSFYGSNLKIVEIPSGVTRFEQGAFRYCHNLVSVDIPEGIEIIESENYQYCNGLQSVSVPASVTSIASDVFNGCPMLQEINVDPNNQEYASVNGIFYNKTLSKLIVFPPAKTETSFEIPEGVTEIGTYAFYGCKNLTAISIPQTVNTIGYASFTHETYLMSVTVFKEQPIRISDCFTDETFQNGTLYVPSGTKALYEAANGWKRFLNIVEMEPAVDYAFDTTTGVLTISGGTSLADALSAAGGRDEVAKTITAILWENDMPLINSDLQGLDNPNMLIYVKSDSLAPVNRDNVVVNGFAKNIVLTDVESGNNNFYCPGAFKAEMISYTRNFQQQTEIGVSRGWETIALPFDVQTIMHEKNGVISPFGNAASTKHFWLRQLTYDGIAQATAIEANTPYIISMPNSNDYPAEFNQAGRVTFSSQNAVVPVTSGNVASVRDSATNTMIVFYPTMRRIAQNEELYALNVGDPHTGYAEGSVFVAGLRDIRPFECYTWHHAHGPAPLYIPVNEIGGTTGIEDVRSQMSDGRGENWYDLNGRRLQQKPTQKGIYILNGRKTVIK